MLANKCDVSTCIWDIPQHVCHFCHLLLIRVRHFHATSLTELFYFVLFSSYIKSFADIICTRPLSSIYFCRTVPVGDDAGEVADLVGVDHVVGLVDEVALQPVRPDRRRAL